MYCAAFCASLVLLAGSGNNLECNVENGGLTMKYARTSFG